MTEVVIEMSAETSVVNEKKPSNKLYIIAAIVLFAFSVVLGWQFLKQKSIAEKEVSEKNSIKEELKTLLGAYENVTSDNEQLNTQLREKETEIKEMLADIDKLEAQSLEQKWLLKKYKKESETLRRLLKGYLYEIDSLGKTITVLKEEKTIVEGSLTKEKAKTVQLSQEKQELNQRVEVGSKFKVYGLSILGVRLKSGDREKEEKRAKRVEKIKACFTIGANDLAKPGERDIYIRVANKNGDVYPKGGDSTNVFVFEGKELAYSGKRTLNYQNQPAEVCVYFQKDNLEPGTYTVDIFADGVKIADSAIILE